MLYADLKAVQQISFTENLDWTEAVAIFFIIGEAK